MKKALLDTNFIITCIREKIDFFEDLKLQGFQIIIPREVILEIERISNSRKKLKFRNEAEIALKLLKANQFKKISLNTRNVDNGISKMAKKDSEVFVGTLDRELKKKIPNSKIVIRGKKKLEVI
jgi:rRNA-processing protein FCF1